MRQLLVRKTDCSYAAIHAVEAGFRAPKNSLGTLAGRSICGTRFGGFCFKVWEDGSDNVTCGECRSLLAEAAMDALEESTPADAGTISTEEG